MKYTELSNNDLCRLYKEDADQQAFNALYRRLKHLVHGRLTKLVKYDTDAVEELEQIIWNEAARSIRNNFKFDSDFSTYLYTIVTTRYINYFRSYKSEFLTEDDSDLMHEMFYTSIIPDVKKVREFSGGNKTILGSLCDMTESTDMSYNDDLLEAYRLISLEMLESCSHEDQVAYVYRIDPSKGMLEASRELNIPYNNIKETAKAIEQEINRRFKEYVEHYY